MSMHQSQAREREVRDVTEDADTSPNPEPMRQLAHALLDSAVGFDTSGND